MAGRLDGDTGSAILVTLMLVVLLGALSGGLVLLVRTEAAISRNYQETVRLRYVAEAGVELGILSLREQPDWSRLLEPGPGAWSVIARGRLSDLVGVPARGGDVVIVAVRDDPDDADGDPSSDSNSRGLVRADAIGRRGARAEVQAVVGRGDDPLDPPIRLIAWQAPR